MPNHRHKSKHEEGDENYARLQCDATKTLVKELDDIAKEMGIHRRAEVIRLALIEFIKRRRKKNESTKQRVGKGAANGSRRARRAS